MSRNKSNKHGGSDFDDFLRDEGIYEQVCAEAAKRVVAAQVAAVLKKAHKTIADFAREMKTSRAAVNRLLDAGNYSVSLQTLSKVAAVLGKRLRVEFEERTPEMEIDARDAHRRLHERRTKPTRSTGTHGRFHDRRFEIR